MDKDSARRYVFFCHSFGTILVTEAGRILESERTAARIPLIVFAGSPLPRNVDLSHLSRLGARVVNDCGDSDMVLLFSESLVLECGMAGRTGIVGFDGVHVLNRFFDASHSSYFCGDSFMTRHWLPLLSLDEPTKVDRRKPNVVRDELLEKLAIGIGTAKKLLWLLALIYLLVDAIRSW